jgi:hypothetical protein
MEALEEFIETELEEGTVKEPEDYGFATVTDDEWAICLFVCSHMSTQLSAEMA